MGWRGACRAGHVPFPAAAKAVSVPKAPGHPKGLMLPPGNALGPAPGAHGAIPDVGPAIPRFLVAFKVSHALLTSKVFKHCDRVAFSHPKARASSAIRALRGVNARRGRTLSASRSKNVSTL